LTHNYTFLTHNPIWLVHKVFVPLGVFFVAILSQFFVTFLLQEGFVVAEFLSYIYVNKN
jgi:hypothetical protein